MPRYLGLGATLSLPSPPLPSARLPPSLVLVLSPDDCFLRQSAWLILQGSAKAASSRKPSLISPIWSWPPWGSHSPRLLSVSVASPRRAVPPNFFLGVWGFYDILSRNWRQHSKGFLEGGSQHGASESASNTHLTGFLAGESVCIWSSLRTRPGGT